MAPGSLFNDARSDIEEVDEDYDSAESDYERKEALRQGRVYHGGATSERASCSDGCAYEGLKRSHDDPDNKSTLTLRCALLPPPVAM